MKVKSLKISHTSLAKWRENPRAFYYEYVLGLRPRSSAHPAKNGSALDFGSLFHKFEELYRSDRDLHDTLNEVLKDSTLPPEGERSQAQLRELCLQYAAKYPPSLGDSELELSFALNERVTYLAHLDKVVHHPDGSLQLIDYKTTSKNLAYDWLPTISPNPQACGYIYAAQQNGLSVSSLTFRGISTDHKLLDPNYVPKKRTGGFGVRPPLFLEATFEPSPEELSEWLAAVTRDVTRVLEDIESDKYTCPCNVGKLCSFRDICLTPATDRATVIRNSYDLSEFRGFSLELENE